MPLKRTLNLFDAILLVVGNVVGAGIFTTSGLLAKELESPILFIGIWMIGGALTLCGALTYAEMSGMFPRSGGDYLFLKAAYGPWAGFLLGWVSFWIINPGSIAVLSIAVVKYIKGFIDFTDLFNEKIAALGVILFFTLLNYRGIRLSAKIQNLCALGSIAFILIMIAGGLASEKGNWENFNNNELESISFFKLFGSSMIAVIFSYSGWFVTAYIGDEVKRPEHNLPLSLFIGTMIVMILYTLLNIVYLYAMPISSLKGVINVGQLVGERLFNSYFARVVSGVIILAIAASINATILAGARIPYAMAEDRLIWMPLKKVHPIYGTPHIGLLFQMGLAYLFIIFETFERLLSYVVFIMLLSSIGSGLAHFVLRRRSPFLPRSYKTWGYPFVPLIFVLSYMWIAGQIVFSNPGTSLLGIAIALSGIPFYFYAVGRKNNAELTK
ncbi:MAG TPA: amino acid permease [Syntrophorhabdaceae bacterium]|mgnify:FL=1|nr:amino acid permease [Syntrophorhabdaceae bacterium]